MAYGLPVEGGDGPYLGSLVEEVPTCTVEETVADARRLLDGAGDDAAVVVLARDGMVVGEVDAETIEGHADGDVLLEVMAPAPTTVRPSVTVASLAEAGGGQRLVTTSDGRLLGAATVGAADHDHDHDENQEAEFDRQLAEVMEAIEERFGDTEPPEAELRSFLHERLVAEGRSPEDADRFLDELDSGADD